jgi:hypothetical protein
MLVGACRRTGWMLAIISGPASPSADYSPQVPARKRRYSALCTRARSLPERRRFDDVMRSGRKALQQPISPLGLLGGAPNDAAHQKELRIMASMPFGVDRFHFDPLV